MVAKKLLIIAAVFFCSFAQYSESKSVVKRAGKSPFENILEGFGTSGGIVPKEFQELITNFNFEECRSEIDKLQEEWKGRSAGGLPIPKENSFIDIDEFIGKMKEVIKQKESSTEATQSDEAGSEKPNKCAEIFKQIFNKEDE